MKKVLIGIFFVLILTLVLIGTIKKDNEVSRNFIVHINSYGDDYSSEGFGFVYKKNENKYFIVTNYHVVYNANKIQVLNSKNEKKEAVLFNFDEYFDIALLTVEDIDLDIPNISTSFDNNDEVYIYGSAENSFFEGKTKGIIVNKKESINVSNSHYDSIKIKIDAKSGHSGTPLFNAKDEVIGMLSLKENDMAYAIPIDCVLNIASLLEQGEIKRPSLGATFINSNKEKTEVEGIVAFNIINGYPLSNAGIKENSIITKINEKRVYNIYDLKEELYKNKIGDTINIECFYDKEYKLYSVYLSSY